MVESQAKAQANAPSVQSTKSVTQNTIPKVDKIPIKTEKEKDLKPLPSVRLPPKAPNAEDTTSGPNVGQDPNVDIEENSPHQEGIITEMYVAPDQSYLEQATRIDKTSEYLKGGTEVSSMTGRYR